MTPIFKAITCEGDVKALQDDLVESSVNNNKTLLEDQCEYICHSAKKR